MFFEFTDADYFDIKCFVGRKVLIFFENHLSTTESVLLCIIPVVPAVPSCSLGLYVPILRPPTPKHGFQINSTSNQIVEISIVAEANESV